MITNFRDKYFFLSNFYPCEIKLCVDDFYPISYLTGETFETYPSVEHGYQAAKSVSPSERRKIAEASTAGKAKRMGKLVKVRDNWDNVKYEIMKGLLIQKFRKGSDLGFQLLNTGDEEISHVVQWHDNYWGVCGCAGCNIEGQDFLGKLLIEIRRDIRDGDVIEKVAIGNRKLKPYCW